MVVACFGPYLHQGVRTEQVVLYASTVIAILRRRPGKSVDPSAYKLIALWIVMLSFALVTVNLVYVPFMRRQTFNGIDDYLEALCAMTLATLWLCHHYPPRRLLDTIAAVVILGAVGSGIFGLVGMWVDTKPLGYYFWEGVQADSDLQRKAGAVVSLSNGRVTGLFNLPAEAGIGYSLGAFAAVYLLARSRSAAGRIILLVSLVIITVGGLISVSKIFILVGIPAAIIQLLCTRVAVNKLLLIVLSPPLVALFVIRPLSGQWGGSSNFEIFLDNLKSRPRGTLNTFTAGRWGHDPQGSVLPSWSKVLHISPWFGLGAGGNVGAPYDSVWLQVICVGGLVGVGLAVCVMLILLWRLLSRRPARPPEVQALGRSLVFLVIFGSFGMTILTANRVAVCLWLLLIPTLFSIWPVAGAEPVAKTSLDGGKTSLAGGMQTFSR